jgi:anti-sigma factor RsiW
MNAARLSESDIQAYADGLLDPLRAAIVRDYLNGRPDEAHRVAFYGRLNFQMQNFFHPWPDDMSFSKRKIRAPLTRIRTLLMGVAASGVLFILFFTALFATGVPQSALDNASVMALEQAMADQDGSASYARAPDVLAHAPNLSSVGFHPTARRDRPVGWGLSATEYIYRNQGGVAVVLLEAPSILTRAQPQWTARRIGKSRLLSWVTQGKRYLLAGRANTSGLMRAADLLTGN